jgi:hypothetical protein
MSKKCEICEVCGAKCERSKYFEGRPVCSTSCFTKAKMMRKSKRWKNFEWGENETHT